MIEDRFDGLKFLEVTEPVVENFEVFFVGMNGRLACQTALLWANGRLF
jgi:hypothetical protein